MASLVDLKALVTADATGFRAGLSAATRDLNAFEARTSRAGRAVAGAFDGVGASARALGPILAGIGAGQALTSLINQAREFESAMGVVQAASGATATELEGAEEIIRRLGVEMRSGAREAATAAEELLKAGLSVRDLQEGALQPAMTMAAATGGTMADGANIAARASQNFGIAAGEMAHVTEQAAGVINATTFGLQDYSLALGMAGNAAASAGVSFEDFNAVLALSAPAFSSGSDAGTSFKTFLQRLGAPTREASAIMKELSFSAFDAEGRFRGMEEVAANLNSSFSGLSQEARQLAVVTIFGADAQRTANVLIDKGAAGLREMRDVTIEQADASAMAKARWAGLNGALAQFSANWQELSIAIAQSGVQDFLKGVVDVAADAIDSIATLIRNLGVAQGLALAIQNPFAASAYAQANGQRGSKGAGKGASRGIADREAAWAALWANGTGTSGPTAEELRRIIASPSGSGSRSGMTDREFGTWLDGIVEDINRAGAMTDGEFGKWLDGIIDETQTFGQKLEAEMQTAGDGAFNALRNAFIYNDWDNLGETLLIQFRQLLFDALIGDEMQKAISGIVKQLSVWINGALGSIGSGSSDGNLGGAIVNFASSLFGGARAAGGPGSPGRFYLTGEKEPEIFAPPGAGNFIPLSSMNAKGGGAIALTYAPQMDNRGVDAAQLDRIERTQQDMLRNFRAWAVEAVQDANARRHRR